MQTRAAARAAAPAWRAHLLEGDAAARQVVERARRVAVLGVKPESRAGQAAFYVPDYLVSAGVDVVPVMTYYPDETEWKGRRVLRRLADVEGPVDVVDVFRKPEDCEAHLPDILAMDPLPGCVWLQSGIRNAAFAESLAKAGIDVVQDRCLLVDHQRWGGSGAKL